MSRLASSASGQGSGERPQALVGVTWGGSCWRCCSCGPVCLGRELAWGTKQGPGPKTRAENVYQAGEYDKYLFTHLENRIDHGWKNILAQSKNPGDQPEARRSSCYEKQRESHAGGTGGPGPIGRMPGEDAGPERGGRGTTGQGSFSL